MGSLCSGLQSAFSPKQTTQGSTTGTQSGSSTGETVGTTSGSTSGTTTNANTPTFQPFIGSALSGLGDSYAPATSALSTAAAGSTFNPTSYQPWMQQYGDNVQKALLDYQGLQKKQDLSNLAGNQAVRGALGNNTGAQAAYLAGRAPGDQLAASQVALQGFNQANDNAFRAGQFQTGAAGQLGSLASSQAGNVAQLVGAGGGQQTGTQTGTQTGSTTNNTNNNFAGQTAGTNQGTTTQIPGIGSVLSGIAGTALAAFSDERVKENIKPVGKLDDGQIIYKYNLIGSPKTEIGLMAQEVEGHKPEAVGMFSGIKTVDYDKATEDAERARKSGGGGITPFKAAGGEASPASGSMLEKVLHATHHLKKMRDGGSTQPPMKSRFDDGGAVPFGARNEPSPLGTETDMGVGDPNGWGATVERTPQGPSFTDKMGAGLTGLSKMGTFQGSGAGKETGSADPYGLNALGAGLKTIMPRYDDGGAVPERGPLSGITDALSSIPKPFSTGVWAGEAPTPMQRAGAALTQVGGGWNGAPGPFAGVGSHILEQQNMRYKEMAAERAAAELLGKFQGQPTMAAQQMAQAGQIATGKLNGVPTLQAQEFAENQRVHDKPQWGVVGQDQYGNPKYGLIDVTKAMPPRGSGVAPGAAPAGAPAPRASAAPMGAPEERDPSAPPGTVRNPAYASSPAVVAQLPAGSYYTTPSKLWPPQQKDAAQSAQGAVSEDNTGLPPGLITESPVAPNRGSPNLTGEEFLATLDPQDRIKVKKIAAGEDSYPTGMSANKGRGAFLASAVTQYDPTFDVRNVAMRQKTLNSFKAGPVGEQIKSLNTVPGHLKDLYEDAEKLHNFTYLPAINAPYNAIRGQISPDYQKAHAKFEASAAAVSAEMAKVFRASGMSRADFEDWKALLKPNASPETIKGAIQKAVQLIDSRTDALKTQWSEAMGPSIPFTAISPKAQEVFDKLRGDKPSDWGGAAGVKLERPIAQMGLDEINKLPPAQLSDEQLAEVRARRKALIGGTP